MKRLTEIDYGFFCFLQESRIDLSASEILFSKDIYSKSVLLFRQSVEMSCKYLGLLWKIITPDDGKKNIGFIPHKIFKDFFGTDVLKQINGPVLFKQYESELNSYSKLSEKIEYLNNEIKTALSVEVVKRKENQSAVDAMIAFYKATGFKGMCDVESLEKKRGDKKFDEQVEEHRKIVNSIGVCVLCQMFLSFLIWGNIEDTVYPDVTAGTTTLDSYSKTSVITKSMSHFFEIQKHCLDTMQKLHENKLWLKSI
ncbi:MAG: hypothetical protein LBV41_11480 [Cytophagaceae bacterium]|jgi:hypothetical protein|nr:hypothetical protein [Cytophagaceae bacterium]